MQNIIRQMSFLNRHLFFPKKKKKKNHLIDPSLAVLGRSCYRAKIRWKKSKYKSLKHPVRIGAGRKEKGQCKHLTVQRRIQAL